MNKEWIVNNWEQDWDYDHLYFIITKDGVIKRYDIKKDKLVEIEYPVDKSK